MGKPAKGSSSNTSTRAGKKHSYTEPPAPSTENAAAREQGRAQFTAKVWPQPLPARKGSWDFAMDTLCAHFGVKRIRSRNDDNGMRWDIARQQWVYPPLKEAIK